MLSLSGKFGAEPAAGRIFAADESAGRAMISHRLWQSALAADPEVVGQVVQLDGIPYTVVGILEPGFNLHVGTAGFEIAP